MWKCDLFSKQPVSVILVFEWRYLLKLYKYWCSWWVLKMWGESMRKSSWVLAICLLQRILWRLEEWQLGRKRRRRLLSYSHSLYRLCRPPCYLNRLYCRHVQKTKETWTSRCIKRGWIWGQQIDQWDIASWFHALRIWWIAASIWAPSATSWSKCA